MSAGAALGAAREMAEAARRDPSVGNLHAVRAAIAGVMRLDAVGVSAGGHGYNPYRDKGGKFAPGAHKQKPTAGERHAAAVGKAQERVGKAKARVDRHAEKLSAAHEARRAALVETRSALAKAHAAAELARAKPTAKNIKAAQVATNKATRGAAKVGKHETAIAKHTDAHTKATAAHAKAVEAHAKAIAQSKATATKAESLPGKAEPATHEATHGAESVVEHARPLAESNHTSAREYTPMTAEAFESYRESFKGTLSEGETEAALKYSTSMYTPINKRLRTGESLDTYGGSYNIKEIASSLDGIIARSSIPTDAVLLRGARGDEVMAHYSKMKPGDVYVEKSYTSVTAAHHIHDDFRGDVEFRISAAAGTKGAPIPTRKPFEQEILLPRGQKFRVDKSEYESVGRHKKLVMHVTALQE